MHARIVVGSKVSERAVWVRREGGFTRLVLSSFGKTEAVGAVMTCLDEVGHEDGPSVRTSGARIP